jgi:putative hydrolase of the HAD superfamily
VTGFAGIRAVTFDVGGTLLRPWPSVGDVYAAVAAEQGHPLLAPETLNRQFAEAWKHKANFDHSRSAWRALVGQTFAGLLDATVIEAFFDDLYARFARAAAWQLYDDVLPTLREVRARGFRVGLVSNWDERLRGLLEAFQLSSFFDAMAISIEVGWAKPAPEIFRQCTVSLGVPPHGVLHVGDSELEDVRGAEQAGLKALWLDRTAPQASLPRIGRLSALLHLLEKACETEKLN